MPMTLAALKAELETDPTSRGYAGASDVQRASLLNAKTLRGFVPITELASYCAKNGITGAVMALLEVPLGGTDSPPASLTVQTKGVLHTVLSLIQIDFRLNAADADDPSFVAACDALVALGAMTAQQKTDVLALGEARRSRAEVLWGDGTTVTPIDCERARNL